MGYLRNTMAILNPTRWNLCLGPCLYPQVGWDEAERRPVVLEDCVIGTTGPPHLSQSFWWCNSLL